MINNYEDLMAFLSNLRTKDYQRDNFDKFLHKIKFKFDLPVIHIAGSNGKGSVGTIINNIYINQGYKVGYYQSPYFINPSETIKVNNVGIDVSFFDKVIDKYQKEIKKYDLSAFEVETLVAYLFFLENKCDICVIECGMGGEIDATNVVDNILAIITSISLEHTTFLGSTVSEIALEKAGIIKDNSLVLVGKLSEDALLAINSIALEMSAKFYQVEEYYQDEVKDDGYDFSYKGYANLHINNLAHYSVDNACLAISAVDLLNEVFPINEESIRKALLQFYLPGRMNILNINNTRLIIDGAHNPEGAKALKDTFEKYDFGPVHIIFAAFKDKNIDSMLSELGVISKDITLTTFPHERARDEEAYFLYLGDYKYESDCFKAINDKLNEFNQDSILVCGSLAFAGYILNNIDKVGGLNE